MLVKKENNLDYKITFLPNITTIIEKKAQNTDEKRKQCNSGF